MQNGNNDIHDEKNCKEIAIQSRQAGNILLTCGNEILVKIV